MKSSAWILPFCLLLIVHGSSARTRKRNSLYAALHPSTDHSAKFDEDQLAIESASVATIVAPPPSASKKSLVITSSAVSNPSSSFSTSSANKKSSSSEEVAIQTAAAIRKARYPQNVIQVHIPQYPVLNTISATLTALSHEFARTVKLLWEFLNHVVVVLRMVITKIFNVQRRNASF